MSKLAFILLDDVDEAYMLCLIGNCKHRIYFCLAFLYWKIFFACSFPVHCFSATSVHFLQELCFTDRANQTVFLTLSDS